MKRTKVFTGDGSHSFRVDELGEQYHSGYGAITESSHIFIAHGLEAITKKEIHILEIGFGTGLNALLSFIHLEFSPDKKIKYTGIEKYPLRDTEWADLNYTEILGDQWGVVFRRLHDSEWGKEISLSPRFHLFKKEADVKTRDFGKGYDLVYFDAFAPDVQPELWTVDIFRSLYEGMESGGLLLTYSVKGSVRRALEQTGFSIEKLAGPPGKRHILRASK